MKKIIFNESSAKQLGRTLIENDILKLILSGTGCEFTFTGKKLTLTLGSDERTFNAANNEHFPRVAVLINEEFVVKKVLEQRSESITVFESNSTTTVNVKIIKLSEAAFSIAEISPVEIDDDEIITPVPENDLKIEFIGDSITCGYGVDDGRVDSVFTTCVENVMKSYSYLTSRRLNADYSMFSASGYGIISGYTPDGVRNASEIIPPYYESLGYSIATLDGDITPQNYKWDFTKFVPDVIILNLGTNDCSFCGDDPTRQQEFENGYYDFLKTVRKNNPDALILCVLGIMEIKLFPQIENACRRLISETGDKNIHTLELQQQNGNLGFSCNWHPSEDTHYIQAKRIAAHISEILSE